MLWMLNGSLLKDGLYADEINSVIKPATELEE